MLPIDKTLNYTIALFCRSHRNYVAPGLAKAGLHLGQEFILVQLWKEEGVTQSCLAERVGVDVSTMTKTLQRLQAYGLIERKPDCEDTRAMRVFLTEKGRALEPELTAIWNEIEDQTLAGFSVGERALFVEFLERVKKNCC